MKLEFQVISLSIAKQLKKLGVKHDSLFYWDSHASAKITGKYGITSDGEYSAFTSAELWEMIPGRILFKDDQEYCFRVNRLDGHFGCNIYCIKQTDDFYSGICDACVENVKISCGKNFFADTEADALGQMLIFLIKNSLIGV